MAKIVEAFSNRRMAVTLLFMFASTLPLPMTSTGTVFQAWLKEGGVDLAAIGMLALVGTPYSIKFLWAPLLDRYAPPILNRRTGWILLCQIPLIILIGGMGFLAPANDIYVIVVLATLIAFFSATQDIAIDAYRVDVLRPEERGAGASMVNVGGRAAMLVTMLGFALADVVEWKWIFLIIASCLLVGVVTALFAPEPEEKIASPATLQDAVVKPWVNFFSREGAIAILLFIILYKLADTIAVALQTVFLLEVGFKKYEIAAVSKVWGIISTLVGSLIAGGLITKYGVYRSLWIFGVLQAVSNLTYVALAVQGQSYPLFVAAIFVDNFCGGMGTVAFTAFLIGICDKRYSASQFALFTSLFAFTRTWLTAPTGFIVKALGWPQFFLFTCFLAIPGLFLLTRIRRHASSAALEPTR